MHHMWMCHMILFFLCIIFQHHEMGRSENHFIMLNRYFCYKRRKERAIGFAFIHFASLLSFQANCDFMESTYHNIIFLSKLLNSLSLPHTHSPSILSNSPHHPATTMRYHHPICILHCSAKRKVEIIRVHKFSTNVQFHFRRVAFPIIIQVCVCVCAWYPILFFFSSSCLISAWES